jgi:hypothetical protein
MSWAPSRALVEARPLPLPVQWRRRYYPVRLKFGIALAVALAWTMLSVWVSSRWIDQLSDVAGHIMALAAITFIAFVPGFMNAFMMTTLLLDRRPERRTLPLYPGRYRRHRRVRAARARPGAERPRPGHRLRGQPRQGGRAQRWAKQCGARADRHRRRRQPAQV